MFVGGAAMSSNGVCELRCPEHKVADIGHKTERWRWDVVEAIQARAHALKPHEKLTNDTHVTFSK